jgi:hypothetical protein
LYALDWFFNDSNAAHQPTAEDLHRIGTDGPVSQFFVEVVFTDLDEDDRTVLGKYGRGDTATFRRTWNADGSSKLVGHAVQGPGFSAIRAAAKAGERKPLYEQAVATLGLPKWSNLNDSAEALQAWEDDPANADKLEQVKDAELPAAWGFDSGRHLSERIEMILVPAAVDLAQHVGGNAERGSALQRLLGALTNKQIETIKDAWVEEHRAAIEDLNSRVRALLTADAAKQQERINKTLEGYVSGTKIQLVPEDISVGLSGKGSIRTMLSDSGRHSAAELEGHGIQRALMISILSAASGEFNEHGERTGGPAIVLGIEEPEIYQHPARARHFARSLSELAAADGFQVALATHSPYFVRPELFDSLRRCSKDAGRCVVTRSSREQIAMQTGRDAIDVNRAIERKLPAGFSEGFFADVVVLVEGLTDKVIVEELIAKLGSAADRGGISVIDVSGKPELWICRGMLEALGVRVYTIADGDAGVAARKHPDNEDKQNNARASHATATKQFLDAHATLGAAELHGGLATDFDQPSCITDGWACWQDDIENELAAWPSFMEAIDNDASGKGLRSKDAAAYRSAASLAKAEDAPEIFGTLVTAIAGK